MPRRLLLIPACACAALLAGADAAHAQAADSGLVAALRERRSFAQAGACGLEGDGGRLLAGHARAAQFTAIAEAHGVDAVPRLSAALFCDLARAGYRHLAIEVSPPVGRELNRLAASADPMAALRGFARERFPGAPFYVLREEAELLAGAVAAAGGGSDVLWGIDYDVLPETHTLRRLREVAPEGPARAAVARTAAMADSMFAAALATGNPSTVFGFAAPATVAADLRRAIGPEPDSEADRLLEVVERTLAINAHQVAGRFYQANEARAENLRSNFLRAYREAGGAPRVMVKLGANHLVRGRNWTGTFDVGSLLPELAALNGGTAYSILVIGGPGNQAAGFDPATFSYAPAPNAFAGSAWAEPYLAAADSARWTVFDLRSLRADAYGGRFGRLSPAALQVIAGFDAVVVLGGSAPSHPLAEPPPRTQAPRYHPAGSFG